jgi:eukaryotic-like serine/threonine-protein kinase
VTEPEGKTGKKKQQVPDRWTRFQAWIQTPLVKSHAMIAGISFSVAWLLVAVFLIPDTGPAPGAIVPPVVGLRYDEAERKLAEAGLRAALGESRPSLTAPRRYVLAQTPAAGTAVGPDVVVTLDVSAGQLRVVVPTIAGMSRDEAVSVLRGANLEIGQVIERPGPEARGTVLSSQPEGGQQVPQGTPVEIVVSTGPTQLLMPDVVGRELFEVRSTLEQLGLKIGETQYDSTSALPTGLVVSQVPVAGTPVTIADFITIRVSGRP